MHRDGWQFSAAFVEPEVTAGSPEAGAGVGVRGGFSGGVVGGVVGGELKPRPVRSTCVAAPGLGAVAYDVVARLDMSDAWTLPPGEPGRRISNLSVTGGIHVRLPVALGARIVDCAWHIGIDANGPDGEASLVWTSQPRLGESTSPVCSPRSIHVGR